MSAALAIRPRCSHRSIARRHLAKASCTVTSAPTSHSRRTDPWPRPAEHLPALAEYVQGLAELGRPNPLLVEISDLDAADGRICIELTSLEAGDPVEHLLGVEARPHVDVIGIAAGGRSLRLDLDVEAASAGRVIHLLDRAGTSITRMLHDEGRPLVVGPSGEIQQGRIADVCRRAFGLATAPPPGDCVSLVIDLWLGRVIAAAADRPHLTWDEVVGLHPVARTPCTPAQLAERTVDIGQRIRWSTVRQGYIDGEIDGYGGVDASIAEWMDDGMLARWLLGTAPPWSSLLEIVDARVGPVVSDLVAATVGMCPPAPWPPA
jgi:hypothetical protein